MKMIGAAAMVVILAAGQASAAKGDYTLYENSMRAAAKAMRAQKEECKRVPANVAFVCDAMATAQWLKAQALAKASFTNAKKDWDEAARIATEQDARVQRITVQTIAQ